MFVQHTALFSEMATNIAQTQKNHTLTGCWDFKINIIFRLNCPPLPLPFFSFPLELELYSELFLIVMLVFKGVHVEYEYQKLQEMIITYCAS